jgi:hypothetical protein
MLPGASLLLLTPFLVGAANPVVVRANEIEFPATVHARAFDTDSSMAGYHAIAWQGGRSAHAALLEAEISDTDVLDALESLGAKPGDNVPMDAWDKRRDRRSRAPDTPMAGPAVEVLLRLPSSASLVPLASVLEDSGGRGLDLRFGGNRVNIASWKSGCVVCLYSCPGAKVGNARYTMRDYEDGVTRFRTRPGALPPDGTRIGVVLHLAPAPAARCPAIDPPTALLRQPVLQSLGEGGGSGGQAPGALAAGGFRVFRDPVTGQIRQPTPEEAARIAASEPAPESQPAFKILVHPDGMQSVDLHGSLAATLIVTRAPDGTVTVTCLPPGASPLAQPVPPRQALEDR